MDDEAGTAFRISRYIIGAMYITLTFIVMFFLIPLLRFPGKVWQKIFYSFVMFGTLWRGISFEIMPAIQLHKIELSNAFNVFFSSYPSILFFTAYLVILFLWIEIFYFTTSESKGVTLKQIRPYFIGINVLMHTFIIIIFILDMVYEDPNDDAEIPTYNTIYQYLLIYFCALIYLLLSISFAVFGFRFYQSFVKIRQSSVMKQLKRQGVVSKLLSITILFTIFFLVRFVLVILGIAYGFAYKFWWYDPFYYFFCELVAISLMFSVFKSHTTCTPNSAPTNSISFKNETFDEKTPINQNAGWYSN